MVESVNSSQSGGVFGLIGTKMGMSRVFGSDWESIPVTVINIGLNVVSSLRSTDKHGYSAVQIGYKEIKKNKLNKPMLGYCSKLGIQTVSKLKEFRVNQDDSLPAIGSTLPIDTFAVGEFVNVTGVSKGKGYAGAIKDTVFFSKDFTRKFCEPSCHRIDGMCQDPGRVFKGKKCLVI